MDVKQIYEFVNTATTEAVGSAALVQEDLSNIVDVGTALFNANAVDRWVKSLVNQIGRVIFVDRVYKRKRLNLLRDGWEYGSVLEKIQVDLPVATENETWALDNGNSYDPNVFYGSTVSAKFFNSKLTFEINVSFAERQVKQSFQSVTQLNAFLSMLFNNVEKAMEIKIDELERRAITNMIAETMYTEYSSGTVFGNASHVKAVNLLYLYNTRYGLTGDTALTAANALTTPEFLRFAVLYMKNYKDRMASASTLFNLGAKVRFTPADLLNCVMLSDFRNAAEVYLYDANGQLKDESLRLMDADVIPYWQGSGTGYAFTDISKVYATTTGSHAVTATGVLAVMFDRDALGVCNTDRRVTTNYNPKAEFYTNFYKCDMSLFNDGNENFVVFFVADAS